MNSSLDPRISVVMPAYNAARYIREAMESVLTQDVRDLELIVVNDGSTDETPQIVLALASEDARVRVLNQANSGKPAIARNRGIGESRGEILCFLDADDVWRPGKLRRSIEVLDRYTDVDLVFHDVEYMNADGVFSGRYCLRSLDFSRQVLDCSRNPEDLVYLCDHKALLYFMCIRVTAIYMSAASIRKERLMRERLFFAEDVVTGEDIDLWFRMVSTGGVAYLDKPLSGYRMHGQSVTHNFHVNSMDSLIAHIRNYKRQGDFLTVPQRRAYRKRIAEGLLAIGYRCALENRYHEAVSYYARAFCWSPELSSFRGLVKAGLLTITQKLG